MDDPELKAMSAVLEALADLDREAQDRILNWTRSRLDLRKPKEVENTDQESPKRDSPIKVESFAELFDQARPKLEKEKALLGAYWIQICQGQETFASSAVNNELKHLGHGLANVTDCLNRLIDQRPSLILQIRKSGTSKQARKTYKVTQAGVSRVQRMLAGQNTDDNDEH